jgi:hypothetical protein
MIAGLIHHGAATVPMDIISLAIEIVSTCLITFTVSAYFVQASLISSKTTAILPPTNGFVCFLAKLYNASSGGGTSKKGNISIGGIIYPLRFGITMGLTAAIVFFAIIAPVFALLHVSALPFFTFVLGKSFLWMLLGASVTVLEMYIGMCKVS